MKPRACTDQSPWGRLAVAVWTLTCAACTARETVTGECDAQVLSPCPSSDSTCAVPGAACVSVPANMPVDSARWERLGLETQEVLSLEESEWGLFAGTRTGLFRRDASTGEWIPLGFSQGSVRPLLFIRGNPPRLLAGVQALEPRTFRLWAVAGVGLFYSDDGGGSWKVYPRLDRAGRIVFLGDTLVAARGELPTDPNTQIYRLGLYIKVADTWIRIAAPQEAPAPRAIIVDREGRLLIGGVGGVWRVTFYRRP
ncbi:MAG: hypothetical protein KatS3mg081_2139 [Gemmatimonadales bacterium]|nr:MAG: hypothetical protein KatS3mg081_2139 [Gemmatimonadales bacterium]